MNAENNGILFGYQKKYLQDDSRFKAAMWSRQTGKTFTTTLEAVLDVLKAESEGRVSRWTILSVSEARALDAIDNGVKLHLSAMQQGFEEAAESLAIDSLAHIVRIGKRGSYIRAVASKPSTARGMSDNLILDEFAHHQDNRAIWTALLPVVSRPQLKLRVISTPNGIGDKFYELMTEPTSLFSRHTVTIYDAVKDGLPRDIEELKAAMNDSTAWAQEFECQFTDFAGSWIPYELIDRCEDKNLGEYQGGLCFVGVDFAARGDLSVFAVVEEKDNQLFLRELVELKNEKFATQLNILGELLKRYQVCRAALDQTGLGEMPVEEARRRFGSKIEGVIFTQGRKLELASALKEAMEDARLHLPLGNRALREDLNSVKRIAGLNGAPRLLSGQTNGSHADRFWALALAVAAAKNGYSPIEFQSVRRETDSAWDAFYGSRSFGRRNKRLAQSLGNYLSAMR